MEVRPDLLERGRVTEVRVELPVFAAAAELVRLEIDGAGVEVLSTRRLDLPGPESHWVARLRVTAPIGRVPFTLRPVAADGRSAEFRQAFTVVPGETASFPWAAVAASSAGALALAAAALAVARRRRDVSDPDA